jgi:hypothetical protein
MYYIAKVAISSQSQITYLEGHLVAKGIRKERKMVNRERELAILVSLYCNGGSID